MDKKKNIGHFYTNPLIMDKIGVNNCHKLTDSNPLKVIYAIDNTTPLVSLQLFIKMGSVFESEKESGYSHFIEHLVFKSTEKYPKNTIVERAAEYGTTINAYTEYESTCFYLTIPSEYLKNGIEMLFELAFKANFSDDDFHFEKKVILEELKQYQNDPEDSFVENIPALVLENSPYRKQIIGTKESLKISTAKDLRSFYQNNYRHKNAFLVMAGDIKPFLEEIGINISNKENKKRNLKNKTASDNCSQSMFLNTEPKIIYHHYKKNIRNDILAFVLPELSENNPQSHTLALIAKIFAIGNKSRLYQRLYIKENLIDSIKVQSISGLYDGVMIILIHPRQNVECERIVRIFLEEYNDLRKFGIHPEEIEKVKNELVISAGYVYEYMEGLAQSLGNEEILGDYNTFFQYEEDILKISENDIHEQLAHFYNFNMLHIIKSGVKPFINFPKINEIKEHNTSLWNMITEVIPERIKHKNKSYWDDIEKMKLKDVNSTNPEYTVYKSQNEKNQHEARFYVLQNGLKVLLKKTPSKSICGVSMAIRVSQLDENIESLGLNQLTTTMLLYGNEKMNYQQCLDFCSSKGIHFSISNGKETTRLKIKCFAENLPESMEFLGEVYKSPTFQLPHIFNLSETIVSHIERRQDYPQYEAVHYWKELIFGKNSNLVSKDGLKKTHKNINRKKVISWYYSRVLSAPAALCIVGDFDFDETINLVQSIFSENIFSLVLPQRYLYIESSKKKMKTINKKSDQSILTLGGFCMPANEIELRAPMNALSQIIGGDINSRMFDLLREKNGLAYSAEFDYELLSDIGFFQMFTIVDKENEKTALKLLIEMQDSLHKNGVSDDELKRAKSFLIGQSRIDEESILSQAQVISSLLASGYDYDFYLKKEERIENISIDNVMYIINKYFKYQNEYLLIRN
ncbi:MAG: insulinase family protein [Candidatus Cloacimonetes bacterium]|nr:insulinase family protein [Candidatus Cloacimonadota bacterium]